MKTKKQAGVIHLTGPTARKFERFLKQIEFLGDVGRAANKARVGRKLLEKWMEDSNAASKIDTALTQSLFYSEAGSTAENVVFREKIFPKLIEDGEVFRKTGQRHRESNIVAKFAAKDTKAYRWQIVQAANNNDRHFFIALGRILSKEVSPEIYDPIDLAIVQIWLDDREAGTNKIVRQLTKRGFRVAEATVRTRKSRLRLSGPHSKS